jgi:hypothetical protein
MNMKHSTVHRLFLLTILNLLLPYSKVVASADYTYIPGNNEIMVKTADNQIVSIPIGEGLLISDSATCNTIEGTKLCFTYEDNTVSIFNTDTQFLDAKASTILSDSATSLWGDFFFIDLNIFTIGDGFGTIITPWYDEKFFIKRGTRSTETEVIPKSSYTSNQCVEDTPCREEYPSGEPITLIAKPNRNSSLTTWKCSEGIEVVKEERYEVTCEAQFDLIPSLNNERLPSPTPMEIVGVDSNSNSILRSGVFIEGEPPKKTIKLNHSSVVDIKGTIEVDAQHKEQIVEILVVGSYIPSNSHDPIFYMRDGKENILLWDGNLLNLLAFKKDISLTEMQQLTLYQGLLPEGVWKMYFGYRLTDGSMIYNSEPIEINIMP